MTLAGTQSMQNGSLSVSTEEKTLPSLPILPLGLDPNSYYSKDGLFLSKLASLDAEDLDYVARRLVNKTDCSFALAETAKREFLRMCALRFLTEEPLSPNLLADEFWHSFILYTKAYREFCARHFKRFIDHDPLDESKDRANSFEKGKQLYSECFGEEPAAWRNDRGNLFFEVRLADRIAVVQKELRDIFSDPTDRRLTVKRTVLPDNDQEAFTKWSDWNNSWKNWGQWSQWDKETWDRCS